MANDRISFNYDPSRQGYDTTLFKTVSGSPTATGSAIRLNAAEIIGYGDIYKSDVTFTLNIPAVPTAGDDRVFGLKQINNGSSALFVIADDVFSCTCIDTSGSGSTTSTVVPWVSGWEATNTEYQIKWTGFSCQFLVNGLQVAFINDTSIPKVSLSMSVENGNADNMDITSIQVQNTQGYI